MNKDSLREYIFAAQRGDRLALVELLTYSWGIVRSEEHTSELQSRI